MIEKSGDHFDLVCDLCGAVCKEDFDSFLDAVNFKKDKSNNWKSEKLKSGNWIDRCPKCLNVEFRR